MVTGNLRSDARGHGRDSPCQCRCRFDFAVIMLATNYIIVERRLRRVRIVQLRCCVEYSQCCSC